MVPCVVIALSMDTVPFKKCPNNALPPAPSTAFEIALAYPPAGATIVQQYQNGFGSNPSGDNDVERCV